MRSKSVPYFGVGTENPCLFSCRYGLDGLNLQVLREDKRGFGILVSSVPKESNALYSLVDPPEVNS
jgi:hypothetical protein